MDYEKTTIEWKPVSEYAGGRVLATNDLDLLIGEINSDGDCISEDESILLCGITAFADIDDVIPKTKESEDERIRKKLISLVENWKIYNPKSPFDDYPVYTSDKNTVDKILAWLEKQSEDARNIALRTEYEKGKADAIAEMQKEQTQEYLKGADRVQNYEELTKFEKGFDRQKPADKVEPKFKVGDFLVNDYCMGKVIELTNDAYLLDTGQGIPFSCEHNVHLWPDIPLILKRKN